MAPPPAPMKTNLDVTAWRSSVSTLLDIHPPNAVVLPVQIHDLMFVMH
jgi:hypothetical protein